MKEWEYKIIRCVNQPDLDRAGRQGWELVSITTRADDERFTRAYLKRPLTPRLE